MKRRITAFALVFLFCMSLCPTAAFAAELDTQPTGEYRITVMDESGEYVNYIINDSSVTEIPIYTYAEATSNTSRALTNVATLRAYTGITILGTYKLFFEFQPTTALIALSTIGFTGTLNTFHSAGNAWGSNAFLAALSGSCEAASGGIGTLSGTYVVLGYEAASILQTYVT